MIKGNLLFSERSYNPNSSGWHDRSKKNFHHLQALANSVNKSLSAIIPLEQFMAVPKKKTSVQRKALRRAGHTHKLSRHFTMKCPNCAEPTLPLHVCPACGTYKGREVIKFKQKAEATPAQ
jgi:large subunit ribosomal protein L32